MVPYQQTELLSTKLFIFWLHVKYVKLVSCKTIFVLNCLIFTLLTLQSMLVEQPLNRIIYRLFILAIKQKYLSKSKLLL